MHPMCAPCCRQALKQQKNEPNKKPRVVRNFLGETLPTPSDKFPCQGPVFDAVVCGGTLGVFIAAALQMQGHSVAVVDRRPIQVHVCSCVYGQCGL